jgi:hypothetical protein
VTLCLDVLEKVLKCNILDRTLLSDDTDGILSEEVEYMCNFWIEHV